MPSSLDSLIQHLSSQRPWWQGGTTREWIDPKASWWSRFSVTVSWKCHNHQGYVNAMDWSTRMLLWRQGQSNQQRYQVKNGTEQQEAASFMSLADISIHPSTKHWPNTSPSCRQDSLELGLSCASKTSMLPKEELLQDPETAHAGHISSECCLYSLGTPLSARWLVTGNPARLNCGSDLFLLILLKQSNVGKWRSKIGQPATLHFKCSTAASQSSEVHTTVECVLATRAILFQFVLLPPSYVISCLQTIDVRNMMARKWATGIGRTSCIPWSHKSLWQSWAAQLLGMLVPSR